MKDLNEQNRPYEKFMSRGAAALTDSELLGIIIRTGTVDKTAVELADKVLDLSKNHNIGDLASIPMNELRKIKGIGEVKAIQIKCIAELSKRISKADISFKKDFSSPDIIAGYYMEELRHLSTEHLLMVMLNTKYCYIGDVVLSKGTVNSSLASTRETFVEALKHDAVYIILIHNHPSGDPTPSKDDIATTLKMKRAGDMIGISLIDHIIIGDNKYISLKKLGYV